MTIKANPDWLQRRQIAESELEIPTEEASWSPAVGCLLKFLFLKDLNKIRTTSTETPILEFWPTENRKAGDVNQNIPKPSFTRSFFFLMRSFIF